MSETVLHAQGLEKRFGAVVAASEINVEVPKGACLGLIGTNGAGKTTFVNMITGYLKPDEGRITFGSVDITGMAPREITRFGVCRSFQIPQLYNSMTALENLEAAFGIVLLNSASGGWFVSPRTPVPGYGAPIRELAEQALERFELTAYRDKVTRVLPGGVRKVLDIAMAMAVQPTILLLDEPTSGVSAEEKFGIMDMVMGVVREAGTTVLFVEHDMEVVARHADRVLAFYDGRIIADGKPDEALNHEQVLKHIVGNTQHATTGQ
jgi:branched-chain amino acid transport system ATP-binding protein